jgi:hypothetical protein
MGSKRNTGLLNDFSMPGFLNRSLPLAVLTHYSL